MLYNKIMRRRTKIQLIVFIGLLVYFTMSKFFSSNLANILATVILGITFVKYCELKIKMHNISSDSFYKLSNSLWSNKNMLVNNYCVVKYIKNEKIIVVDNPRLKNRTVYRAFVVDKTNCMNISSCWANICSIYNEYAYLDTLFLSVDKGKGKFNIIYLDPPKNDFEADKIENFILKPLTETNKKQETNDKKNSFKGDAKIGDIVKQKNKFKSTLLNRSKAESLNDLEKGKKIYVNYSDAQDISLLPGVNIVKAKNIVAYRDVHGLFKSKEDFIKISNVKEHFESIIYGMISLEKYDPAIDEDIPETYGRIVDCQ